MLSIHSIRGPVSHSTRPITVIITEHKTLLAVKAVAKYPTWTAKVKHINFQGTICVRRRGCVNPPKKECRKARVVKIMQVPVYDRIY